MTSGKFRTNLAGYVEKMMRVFPVAAYEQSQIGTCNSIMVTGHWVIGTDGRSNSAAAAVIMDNALAAVLRNSIPELSWMVTTELQLTILRPLPTDGTKLEAWCRPLAGSRTGGTSMGLLQSTDGIEYIHASGNFFGVPSNDEEGLNRYDCTAGLPLGTDENARLDELFAVDASHVEILPTPSVATEHFVRGLGFNRKESLQNSHGAIHGGGLMIMASIVAQAALPNRQAYTLQSIRVAYLRPGFGEVASRTRIRHIGRLLRILDVELYSAETGAADKPLIQATVSFRAESK